jgi:hypothetical protein
VTTNREIFGARLSALGRLLKEIDGFRRGRSPLPGPFQALDDIVAHFGVRDWPQQIAANDEPIGRAHVQIAEMVLDLAQRTLDGLRGLPPPTSPPTPPHGLVLTFPTTRDR